MHTATMLERSQFSVRIEGTPSEVDDLFPGWGARDRLGVVVREPFGAVGASHLIQLATTLFYDIRPSRRDTSRTGPHGEPLAQYADIYLFHVGGPWGNHGWFDIWPSRKEVMVGEDPRDLLDALLDRAITWLAVPDTAPIPVEHFAKDPAEGYDRLRGAFAYSPSGRTADADVEIAGLDKRTEFNPRKVLDPDATVRSLDDLTASAKGKLQISDHPELRKRDFDSVARARANEGREGLPHAVANRAALRGTDGTVRETYRRIPLGDALWMLGTA